MMTDQGVPNGATIPDLAELAGEVISCRRCPRLVAWRERAAVYPPARYATEEYWARPVPGFGDPAARLMILGLAPAAHGGNRSGRLFTGDRSGDFLFAALHRAGLANQPGSVAVDDGLVVAGVYITAAVRCAPPDNKPLPSERDNCRPYLLRELALLADVRAVLALGRFAWDAARTSLELLGQHAADGVRFGHGAEMNVGRYRVVGSYHPSQQNTFTGRLTPVMLDRAIARAWELAAPD